MSAAFMSDACIPSLLRRSHSLEVLATQGGPGGQCGNQWHRKWQRVVGVEDWGLNGDMVGELGGAGWLDQFTQIGNTWHIQYISTTEAQFLLQANQGAEQAGKESQLL
jgi:hypothetical protein